MNFSSFVDSMPIGFQIGTPATVESEGVAQRNQPTNYEQTDSDYYDEWELPVGILIYFLTI